ncbi:MAG: hypothetical protein M1436_03220 [Acidobacteria bacterium]|nr:hypothetical protein [Acidobacteriota bacterium]
MPAGESRPDPDLLLRQVQAEETRARRGRLKVFLGYSSGVGKTFTMLDEGRRRRERNGEDVVVGALQEKRPPEAEAILARLEVIPTRQINGRPCIDVPALLRRRPRVCLIDGLAYENPGECGNEHRWQDVRELLDAGISVITTINLQYIAEYQDRVAAITGRRPSVTVPLTFIQAADDIEIVDAPAAEAVQHADGEAAGSVTSRKRRLAALRELAMYCTACTRNGAHRRESSYA